MASVGTDPVNALVRIIQAESDFPLSSQAREQTAKYAKENGYDAITTTLLVSPYQKHEELKQIGGEIAKKYGLTFLYRDFRVGFRDGQAKAREIGMYMQKYCGCIFSEEDRYSKQIEKDRLNS